MTTVGTPSAHPRSHSVGAISEPALGRVCPGPGLPAAMHWARLQTLLSHLPRLQMTWEEKEARELARLLGRRRDPQAGLVRGSLCWDRRGKDASFLFPPAALGRGGRGGGSALPQSQPPIPMIPPLLGWKPPPVGDPEETAPHGIQGPIPPGQPPPQVTPLPARPCACHVHPQPQPWAQSQHSGKTPASPGGFRNQVSLVWTVLSKPGLCSRGPTQLAHRWGSGPRRGGGEGRPLDKGRARRSTGSAPDHRPFLPALEATLQPPRATRLQPRRAATLQPPRAARRSAEQTLLPFNKRVRDIFLKMLMVLANTTREHSGKSCFRSFQCHPVLLAN